MVKNMTDIIFGGLSYWLIGFGLSFGSDKGSNAFSGNGKFLTDAEFAEMGGLFSKYFFHLSFATTATTIVSGAMVERTRLEAYMFYSFINTMSYVFPARWMWSDGGFLSKIGAVDIAGGGPVHVVGGFAALVATIYLKPRRGRFDSTKKTQMASPTNVVLGSFILWCGWLGFNCGSSYGVSRGKWKLASRAALNTVHGSIGGALFAVLYSCKLNKKYKKKLDVSQFTSGMLGGLVATTAICTLCRPWEAIVIGMVGGVLSCTGLDLMEWLKIDDPVGCFPVHGLAGVWSMISVGLFAEAVPNGGISNSSKSVGLLKGGKASFFGAQVLACICFIAWSLIVNLLELYLADKLFGLRLTEEEERIGADYCSLGISPWLGERDCQTTRNDEELGEVNEVCHENEENSGNDEMQNSTEEAQRDTRQEEHDGQIICSFEIDISP